MSTLLHLDSSPRGDRSVSRMISAAVVEAWKSKNAEGRVVKRDLETSDLTFVDLNWIMGAFTPSEAHTEEQKKAITISEELVQELLSAELIVIGAPMYNFAVPAVLKAWIDHVVRAGKTFRYSESGPEGLAGGRRVIVAVSSAGVYAGPMEAYNFEIPYLRHILGFIGITDVKFIQAGGTGAVDQGKIPAPEFLAPYLEQAKAAV